VKKAGRKPGRKAGKAKKVGSVNKKIGNRKLSKKEEDSDDSDDSDDDDSSHSNS